MEINIIDTAQNSAQKNMKIDEELLQGLDPNGVPLLHIYRWKGDSITYGYFAKCERLLKLDELKKHHINIARRITGGGATFHFCDYAFSFFMPANHPCFSENTLTNYQFVNQFVKKSVQNFLPGGDEPTYYQSSGADSKKPPLNYCMAKPTVYDVILKGKKIGGAAQRKKNQGYLHHGSISIALPDRELLREIVSSHEAYDAILKNSHYFIDNHLKRDEVAKMRSKIQESLIKAMRNFIV